MTRTHSRPKLNRRVRFIASETAYGLGVPRKRDQIVLLMHERKYTQAHTTAEFLARGWAMGARDVEHWWRAIWERFYAAALNSGVVFTDLKTDCLELLSMRNHGIMLCRIRMKDQAEIRRVPSEDRMAVLPALMTIQAWERTRGERTNFESDEDEGNEDGTLDEQDEDSSEESVGHKLDKDGMGRLQLRRKDNTILQESNTLDQGVTLVNAKTRIRRNEVSEQLYKANLFRRTIRVLDWPVSKADLARTVGLYFPDGESPIESVTYLSIPAELHVVCVDRRAAKVLVEAFNGKEWFKIKTSVVWLSEKSKPDN